MQRPDAEGSRSNRLILVAAAVVLIAGIGLAMSDLPARFGISGSATSQVDDDPHSSGQPDSGHGHQEHHHGGHGHTDDGHSDEDAIELSQQARQSLGLRTKRVSLGTFTEYIEVPGLVTNWPGRTHIVVTSPLTGVINAIHVSRGELIEGNAPLFSLRLTHQDLVKTQEQYLTQLGELDVEEMEIARLTSIASSGAVAGKTLIARQYERDKLMAGVQAARQSMLLHGLTQAQIDSIEKTRELVGEITVFAPQLHEDTSLHHDALHERTSVLDNGESISPSAESQTRLASLTQPADHPAHVDTDLLVTVLDVSRGQSVLAGETLAQLSDYSVLLIEGHAFQRDNAALRQAAQSQLSLQAVLDASGEELEVIDDLKIVNIGNEVGKQSRALPFYVQLINQIERSEMRDGRRYVSWRYKPGQRLQLRLPIKTHENVIVVPREAVGESGLEQYVFVDRGDHLDRIPVRLVARGPINVAIANDGQLSARHRIAINSAHQLLMALRNQAGGGIDPHAGHSH